MSRPSARLGQSGPVSPSTTPLLPPPTMPRTQGRAPVQPVKETVRNSQHTGCKNKRRTPTFRSATDDDDDTGWQMSCQHVAKICIKKKILKTWWSNINNSPRISFTSSSRHILLVLFFCLAFFGLLLTSISLIKNNPPLFQGAVSYFLSISVTSVFVL